MSRFIPSLAFAATFALTACADPAQAPSDTNSAEAVTEETAATTEPVTGTDRQLAMNGLAGSFRDAGSGAPAMLIVPGSGPTDRDGNSPMGVNSNMYRLIADGLEADGISTLRVDKRGMHGSASAGDPNAVSVPVYAQDYRDWAERLRGETGQDCVWMMGHSEGSLMVLAAAAEDDDGICGLVLAAAPGRPLGDVLREQLRANPANAPVLADAMGAIDALERGETVDVSGFHPALQGLFNPAVQDFLKSIFPADPSELVAQVDRPILVLQGDRDIQVSLEDARRLEAAGAELVIIPEASHLLKPAPEDRAGNMATYADPELPLSEGVVSAVADFVNR